MLTRIKDTKSIYMNSKWNNFASNILVMKEEIGYINEYRICQIDKDDIPEVVKFVIETNYKKHHFMVDSKFMNAEIAQICDFEEKIFDRSVFYTVIDKQQQIVGALRISNENKYELKSPNAIDLISANKVYHIGRFAIDQANNSLGAEIFKKMIVIAFSFVYQDKNNILIADCDTKLYRVLRRMGVNLISIGAPFFSIGSETVSVYLPYENMIKFYLEYNSSRQL